VFFLSYQFWALIIRSAGKQDFLDKGLLPVLYFLLEVLQIKGNDEEEYTYPLTRESGCMYALEGCFKTGMWKVASKPESRDRIFWA
jgi:hypothetical protein